MRFSPLLLTLLLTLLQSLLFGCIASQSGSDDPQDDGGTPGADTDGTVEDPPTPGEELTVIGRIAERQLDLLFVIDDSGSMCEEQRNLTRNFRIIAEQIIEEGIDARIAVTSTDMHPPNNRMGRMLVAPVEPVPSLNCQDRDTGEPLAPDTADCQALIEAGTLTPILRADAGQEALEQHFRCLATLGTQGDGFEKGLEAMRTALSCQGPNADRFRSCCVEGRYDASACDDPEFLRPSATLGVVILSDENDCSDPAANPAESRRAICKYGAVDGDVDGVPDGYQDPELCEGEPADCYRAECGDLNAEECRLQRCVVSRSVNSNCEWERDTLVPVEDYEAFLRGLKGPGQLIFAAIVGIRDYTERGDEISYEAGPPHAPECDPESDFFNPDAPRTLCCPEGLCRGHLQPACESDNGVAFTGRRYLQLAEALGGTCQRE